MAAPQRHGQRWSRMPTPLHAGGDPYALRGDAPTPAQAEAEATRVVPVSLVENFLAQLPRPNLSFVLGRGEVRYNHALVVGGTLQIASMAVPGDFVWVINDVEYYAFGPPLGLQGPPTRYDDGALAGLLQLTFNVNGRQGIQISAKGMSPYTTSGQTAASTSGWPWLNKRFGADRMPSYALYAQGGDTITVSAQVEDMPRFPISRVGVNIHGFQMSDSLFDQLWASR